MNVITNTWTNDKEEQLSVGGAGVVLRKHADEDDHYKKRNSK